MLFTYREPVEKLVDAQKTRVFINFQRQKGEMALEHWHQCAELLYVFGGTALQKVNATSVMLHPRSCLLVADGDIHSTSAVTEDCYILVVQFFSPFPQSSLYLPACDFLPELDRVFTLLNGECTLRAPGYQNIAQGLLYQALGLLERFGKPLPDSVVLSAQAMEIADFIQSHILEGVSLADTARFAGYSTTYFSRYFQKLMGISFRSYTEEIRMRTAKKLLLAGWSVSGAAEALQYDGISSFSRAFKRKFGQSPGLYLESQKMDNKP